MSKLQQSGSVNVLELCKLLDVSSVTIRKDLKLLEDRQLLFRTHGGATLINPYTADRTVFEKERIQAAEKAAIAKEAVSMIRDNDSIIIASGTTVQAMAKEIQPIGNLTVVTSALNVAVQLIKHPNIEILQLGGSSGKVPLRLRGFTPSGYLLTFSAASFFSV